MQRFLLTREILGTILIRVLAENKEEIQVSEINSSVRIISGEMQKKCNTVVDYSVRDVYSFVDDYNKYFYLNEGKLIFSEYTKEKLKNNAEEVKDLFNTKFIAGLPEDVVLAINKIEF